MNPRPLQAGKKYSLKHTTQTAPVLISALDSRINIQTFDPEPAGMPADDDDLGDLELVLVTGWRMR